MKPGLTIANKYPVEIGLLLVAFIIPSLLLYADVLPRSFFFLILGGFPALALLIYVCLNRVSPRRLGLTLDLASIRAILPATLGLLLLGGLVLVVLPWVLGRPRSLYLEASYYGWYLGMSIFQEVIWRGFAILLLKKLLGDRENAVVLGSASLFAFSHIYFRSVLILLGTWLLGWLWGKHYWRFRSLSGPIISHYLVGFPFILLNYMGGNQHWRLF